MSEATVSRGDSAATIVQVNISPGGVPKLPVPKARVGRLGLEGDGHDDKEHHGGPERALCIFAIERIEALQAEGHPIFPGSAGENVTVRGVDWEAVGPGTRFRLGDSVVAEVTRDTTPCKTIRASFDDGDFNRIHQRTNPGWSRVYARVLTEGVIRAGDSVVVENPPG